MDARLSDYELNSLKFVNMVNHVTTMLIRGHLSEYGFFSANNTSERFVKDLNRSLGVLSRPEYESNLKRFMSYYRGETTDLTTDEFPIFGYDGSWICTNKRVFCAPVWPFGLAKPIIELSKIVSFTAVESKGIMELHYGFFDSEKISIPGESNGIFSSKFDDIFEELTEIFKYICSFL